MIEELVLQQQNLVTLQAQIESKAVCLVTASAPEMFVLSLWA
jgi:hypothetical protein